MGGNSRPLNAVVYRESLYKNGTIAGFIKVLLDAGADPNYYEPLRTVLNYGGISKNTLDSANFLLSHGAICREIYLDRVKNMNGDAKTKEAIIKLLITFGAQNSGVKIRYSEQQKILAEKGDTEAEFKLGNVYFYGEDNVEKIIPKPKNGTRKPLRKIIDLHNSH